MSPSDVGALFGVLLGGVLSVLFVIAFLVALFGWPLLLFSAVRSLRRIAAALEQLNQRPTTAATHEPEIGPWPKRVSAAQSPASTQSPSR